ncbi:hypothetical protein DQ04_00551190 [Trypanosoma grayi]|uniref:hypothetical protein n=1 Tax=Trypanosoma grayi TaxID=71804 RepID=UPI0004F3F329|nr:hypothetical protein DQ04_00551190 [Trypanosoma grayi]KEG14267.1 hypothetical protein DQ04_00551190 [Trypanosoma grayi]
MNSKYLSAPVNISRFIEMSSRSLSPQREILQMTAQLHRPRPSKNQDPAIQGNRGVENKDVVQQIEHQEQNTVQNTAYLLQCGSALYDPVKEGWRCWNGHELRIKERAQYGPVDGVSCDFCGYTDWLEELREVKEVPKTKGRGGKRPRAKTVKKETLYFYHCDVCGMDLCTHCAKELRDDSRYHVPCMQCRRCLVFMRDDEAVLHRCYMKHEHGTPTLVTPSSSASGGASSSSHAESVAPLALATQTKPSPPVLDVAPMPQRPKTTWEVFVTFETAVEEALVRRIGEALAVEEAEAPEEKGQRIFRTRTRLAAEEFAQRIHDTGLFASLRRFRL